VPNNESDETVQAKLLGAFEGHGHGHGHDWEGEVVSQIALQQIISHNLFVALQNHRQENPQQYGDNHASMVNDDRFGQISKDSSSSSRCFSGGGSGKDQSSGCTASVVLQLDGRVYGANAGDSQPILVTDGPSDGSTHVHVPFVTREDKPHLEEESECIRKSGCIVTLPNAH
jgi:serine/threonine protein phosphatase PrpC